MKTEIEIVLKYDGKEVTRRILSTFNDAIECLVWMWIVFHIRDLPKE